MDDEEKDGRVRRRRRGEQEEEEEDRRRGGRSCKDVVDLQRRFAGQRSLDMAEPYLFGWYVGQSEASLDLKKPDFWVLCPEWGRRTVQVPTVAAEVVGSPASARGEL
ncbi:hypothetical protein HPB47_027782 [Ixodes persulcatus]|uniref:Uncharacterized protein n=1 Tax=Ixodes persulcatus TaxID=34615 RepID=A0AC60PVK7_IXOPE|nr:hypothetical protein HPB47_027782 [Ixodes persulcatus]